MRYICKVIMMIAIPMLTQVQAGENMERLSAVLVWLPDYHSDKSDTDNIRKYHDTIWNYCLEVADYLGIENREPVCKILIMRKYVNPLLM